MLLLHSPLCSMCDRHGTWCFIYPLRHVRIPRNVTVTGARGTSTIFDQAFLQGKVQLCGTCTWTFTNITVANDRKSSDQANDLFVAGQLGARLILRDAVVLRPACPSPADALGVLNLTPRSAAFGYEPEEQQQHGVRNVTVQVRACRVRHKPAWAHSQQVAVNKQVFISNAACCLASAMLSYCMHEVKIVPGSLEAPAQSSPVHVTMHST